MNKKKIMTLGIFAHANAGKTTITEQLLYHANVKKTRGRVDHGDTSTDNLKVERERGISVRASMVSLPLGDTEIQLIDTPGHVDFSAEVERAISVLDGAVLVVSGVEGVEPQTQVIWKILQERKVPTIFFINKMDRMGANYDRVVEELQSKLNPNIIPIVNVKKLQDGTLEYSDVSEESIIETLADIDEHVLEKYLNDEKISRQWLSEQILNTTQTGNLFFVYGGSALLDDGMFRLMHGIEKYLPTSPSKKSDMFSGYVYTVKRDNGTRELYLKVLDGKLNNRQELEILPGIKQRVRTVTKIDGTKRVRSECLETGEIGIITGIDAKCGDIVGNQNINFRRASFVNPLFHTTVTSKNKDKMLDLVAGLEILNDEDPDLNLVFNKSTGQISIDLMGPLQTEIIANLLKERYGVDAIFSDPIIIHKETPIQSGTGMSTFDRVSAVEFEIKPLPRGSGLHYVSKVSTDYLFAKYQKQIERLIGIYSQQGLYGWEITDAEISLIGGKSDSVCSDPSHFNIIVPIALMRSIKDAGMQLLEPIMSYEISTPKDNFKTILASLSSMGVDYENIEHKNEIVIIPGKAPLESMLELPMLVTRQTGGHGSLIKRPSGYELKRTPEIVTKQVIGPDPTNEDLFLMAMNCSADHLDRPSKRR